MKLKKSTISTLILGPFVKLDGVTLITTTEIPVATMGTGIRLSKNGAALAAKSATGDVTFATGTGCYYVPLSATDTASAGTLRVQYIDAATCLPVWLNLEVCAGQVYDSLVDGTDLLDASVVQWTGTAVATPDTAGYPKVTIKNGSGAGEIITGSGSVGSVLEVGTCTGVVSIDAGGISASTFATGAINSAAIASGAIDTSAIANGAIKAASFAAGAIDSAAIAANALVGQSVAGIAGTINTFDELLSGAETLDEALPMVLISTTISGAPVGSTFVLAAGSTDNDAYTGQTAIVRDATTPNQVAVLPITDYVGATKTVTYTATPAYTLASGDAVTILSGASIDETKIAAIKVQTDKIPSVETKTDAIKVKTDNLPSAVPGQPGGLFIAGSNAAVTITAAEAQAVRIIGAMDITTMSIEASGGGKALVISGDVSDALLVQSTTGKAINVIAGGSSDAVSLVGGSSGGDGISIARGSAAGDDLRLVNSDAPTLPTVAGSMPTVLVDTTVASAVAGSFTLAAGSPDNDAYTGQTAIVRDATTPNQVAVLPITDYVGATKTVTYTATPAYTLASGDAVAIMAGAVSTGGGGGGDPISPDNVCAGRTWRFASQQQTTAPNKIVETTGFNGVLAMDLRQALNEDQTIYSVAAATVTADDLGDTKPTIVTTMVGPDKVHVHIAVNATAASVGSYVLTVPITTTDGQVLTRRGKLVIE